MYSIVYIQYSVGLYIVYVYTYNIPVITYIILLKGKSQSSCNSSKAFNIKYENLPDPAPNSMIYNGLL